jgi:transposase-like protein
MPKVCRVCSLEHKTRLKLDRELARGGNVSAIARKYDLPRHTVRHHLEKHLSRQLAKATEMAAERHGFNLAEDLIDLKERAQAILDKMEIENRPGLALKSIAEARAIIETFGKLGVLIQSQQPQEDATAKLRQDFDKLSIEERRTIKRLYNKMDGIAEKAESSDSDIDYEAEFKSDGDDFPEPKPKKVRQRIEKYSDEPEPEPEIPEPPDPNGRDEEGFTMAERMRRRPLREIADGHLLLMKRAHDRKDRIPKDRSADPFIDSLLTGRARVRVLK